jgi:ParB family transcriptional regulator, chromosome partitioning protein
MAMARAKQKITLSPSRDIPFDQLILSQSNVRRVKAGVSIGELADDIARRTLLQSLNVRPHIGENGAATGLFEVPAGGRRYRALELLVKQKRLAKDAPVPCIVQSATGILAEEDSYAENAMRENLHPLDQFRAMQAMVDKGADIEGIAAHFMTTPAVVRQRLKLASVSPALHDLYADDDMTLDQLMAFTVSDDHERQVQVWEMLAHSWNKSSAFIRQKLTENSVRAADKRVRFVSVDAYVAAGGSIVRDLFEADDGGWLTDQALLDRLVDEKLTAIGQRIGEEGWKWVQTTIDLPHGAARGLRWLESTEVAMTDDEQARLAALEAEADALSDKWSEETEVPEEVHARLEAIEAEIGALVDRPQIFDAAEIGRAGVFVSIDYDGTIRVDRGFVRPEDEPVEEEAGSGETAVGEAPADDGADDASGPEAPPLGGDGEPVEEEGLKPLPDRLVADLTAWRTLALQDAFAQNPQLAFGAVLHAFVLSLFYRFSHASCLGLRVTEVYFSNPPEGLRDSAPARSIDARHAAWRERLPQTEEELWDALIALDANEQASLFAHCASLSLNAQIDTGQSARSDIAGRVAHSHVLARIVALDPISAGWRATGDGYFRHVTKARILADVTEARGADFAGMIDHLKKPDMVREAATLLEESDWLPEPLRTPVEQASGEEVPVEDVPVDEISAGETDGAENEVAGSDADTDGAEADGAVDRDGDDGDKRADDDWDELPVAAE